MRVLGDHQPRQDRLEVSVVTRSGVFCVRVIARWPTAPTQSFCLSFHGKRVFVCGTWGSVPSFLGVNGFVDGFQSHNVFQNVRVKVEDSRAGKGPLEFGFRPRGVNIPGHVHLLVIVAEMGCEIVLSGGSQDHVVGPHPIGSGYLVIFLFHDSGTKTEPELEKCGYCGKSNMQNV